MSDTPLVVFLQHRHPFIERLGLLYLLKLHNGKAFGNRAGSYWRMLFVLAVFPWMRNYRVSRGAANLMMEVEAEISEAFDEKEQDNDKSKNTVKVAANVWDPSDSIETLAAKRRALKNQLNDLNKLLSEKLSDKEVQGELNAFERNKLMQSTRMDVSFASRLSV